MKVVRALEVCMLNSADGVYVFPLLKGALCSESSPELAAIKALKALLLQHGTNPLQLASWDTDKPGEAGEASLIVVVRSCSCTSVPCTYMTFWLVGRCLRTNSHMDNRWWPPPLIHIMLLFYLHLVCLGATKAVRQIACEARIRLATGLLGRIRV
jgi:hypothetical protein